MVEVIEISFCLPRNYLAGLCHRDAKPVSSDGLIDAGRSWTGFEIVNAPQQHIPR